jgi:predicted nicotinamide N-methyase
VMQAGSGDGTRVSLSAALTALDEAVEPTSVSIEIRIAPPCSDSSFLTCEAIWPPSCGWELTDLWQSPSSAQTWTAVLHKTAALEEATVVELTPSTPTTTADVAVLSLCLAKAASGFETLPISTRFYLPVPLTIAARAAGVYQCARVGTGAGAEVACAERTSAECASTERSAAPPGLPGQLAQLSPSPPPLLLMSRSAETGVGGRVWLAGYHLVEYLRRRRDWVAGAEVIELGAGTGFVGIEAARLGAACVALTDLGALLPLLRLNLHLNLPHASSHLPPAHLDAAIVHVMALKWGEGADALEVTRWLDSVVAHSTRDWTAHSATNSTQGEHAPNPAAALGPTRFPGSEAAPGQPPPRRRVVLACECVYQPSTYDALLETMVQLAPRGANVATLLAHRGAGELLTHPFFRRALPEFEWVSLEEADNWCEGRRGVNGPQEEADGSKAAHDERNAAAKAGGDASDPCGGFTAGGGVESSTTTRGGAASTAGPNRAHVQMDPSAGCARDAGAERYHLVHMCRRDVRMGSEEVAAILAAADSDCNRDEIHLQSALVPIAA